MNLLLALQHWNGDQQETTRLCRLIADLEPAPRTDVSAALVRRNDAHENTAGLAALASKFPTFSCQAAPGLVGHPGGCNTLWRASVLYAASHGFDFVLTFEADCTPLARDWIDRIRDAVEEAIDLQQGRAVIFGAKKGLPRHPTHVNGNCVVRLTPMMVKAIREYVPRPAPRDAWDLALYPTFERLGGCVDLREIRSDWRSEKHSRAVFDKWVRSGVVLHHGTRDGSLIPHVRDSQQVPEAIPEAAAILPEASR